MTFRLPRLPRDVSIIDDGGKPLLAFQRWWQSVVEKTEGAISSIEGNSADIAANAADLAAAQVSLTSLDARIDAYDALGPFVQQHQTATWATPTGTLDRTTFSTPTFTVSATPTQAEVQAIASHVTLLSQHLAALIADLRANNALT